MKQRIGVLVLGLLASLLCGCSVSSVQGDMVREALPGGKDLNPDDYAWVMKFNDTQALVYSVQVQGGIVFANRDGLQIGFDGWDVVLVSGLAGAVGDITVRKDDANDGVRVHSVEGVGTYDVQCQEPQRTSYGWLTDCRHMEGDTVYRMPQRLDIGPDGEITRIEAYLVPGAGPMILTPFKS